MTFLVVLGMHRSGSSALTGALSHLGMHPGRNLSNPNRFNELGYFEIQSLNVLLDTILFELGRSWRDERLLPYGWVHTEVAVTARQHLASLLKNEYESFESCVMKDPRLCRLLPLIRFVFQDLRIDPSYLFSLRSPIEVIESLVFRDAIHPTRAALLYIAYMLESERDTRTSPRAFIDYESLLNDWRCALTQVDDLLNLNLSINNVQRAEHVDKYLSTDLRHHSIKNNHSFHKNHHVELAVAIYDLLRMPFTHEVTTKLDSLRAEWLASLTSLDPWMNDAIEFEKLRIALPKSFLAVPSNILDIASANTQGFIYWAFSDRQFSESQMLCAKWQFGSVRTLRFQFPRLKEPLTSLRLKISNCPGLFIINRFFILDDSGKECWVWQGGTPLFQYPSHDFYGFDSLFHDSIYAISKGSDPHAEIQLPKEILIHISEGYSIGMEFLPKLLSESSLDLACQLEQLLRMQDETRELQQKAESEISKFMVNQSSLVEKQADLVRQLEQSQVEILRAEGQLSLLKQLFISDRRLEDF